VTLGDQIQKVTKANFGAAWEEAGASHCELEDTYSLSSMGTLEEAVKNIISFLGMQPVERSDRVPEGKSSHTLLLAGRSPALHCRMGKDCGPYCLESHVIKHGSAH
jgi:coatomer protein complex subunit gamma